MSTNDKPKQAKNKGHEILQTKAERQEELTARDPDDEVIGSKKERQAALAGFEYE